jgi:hypothetical protein
MQYEDKYGKYDNKDYYKGSYDDKYGYDKVRSIDIALGP